MTKEIKTAQEMLADYIERKESGQPLVVADEGLNREEVEAELEILRSMSREDTDKRKGEREALEKTQQKRQREFLERSWAQARGLLQDENLELLAVLLDSVGIEISDSFAKRCEQIASLQIGYRNKDGKWKTTARREVRMGQLYAVFHANEWAAEGLAEVIEKEGGTTKLLDAANKLSPTEKAKLIRDRKDAMRNEKAVMVPMDDFAGQDAAWRLALVSTHQQGLRVHSLLDQKGASVDRYVDAHVKALAAEKQGAQA